MADNFVTDAGSGGNTYASDDIGGVHYPILKIAYGALDSATLVSTSNGLPVAQQGTWNVGTVTAVTDITNAVAVTDNSGSLTVDNAALSVVGGGAEATALRVTLANDSTGVVSVDDNGSTISIDDGGGAITVDGTVGVSGTVTVDLGVNNDVTVTGTVTANLSATDNAVLDVIATPVATISSTPVQRVAIFDASDTQITTFGGGAQYTEGDTDASITGTAILWEDGSNTLATVSAASPLPVEIVAGAGSGGTASADDADFTATSTSGTPAMGVYESSPTNVTDGDMGIVGITQARRLKVDATGTVDLGATDNAVLDAIAASVAAIDVDATTIIGHVDGIEGLLTTIDADTGNVVTSVQLLDDTVTVLGTDTYTETTSKGLAIGAVRRDADTTLVNTTNEWGPLQMDANGRLKVEAFSGEALPITDNNSSITVDNGGTFAVQATIATATGWGVYVEDAAETAGGNLMMAGNVRRDTIASSSNASGDNSTFNTNDVGALWTTTVPSTNGGLSTFNGTSSDGGTALTNTAQAVKASAGQLYGWYIYNPNDEVSYVNVYNTASGSVTVGTTNPLFQIPVPPASAANILGGVGIAFGTAISASATKTAGSNTAPDVAMECVLFYK